MARKECKLSEAQLAKVLYNITMSSPVVKESDKMVYKRAFEGKYGLAENICDSPQEVVVCHHKHYNQVRNQPEWLSDYKDTDFLFYTESRMGLICIARLRLIKITRLYSNYKICVQCFVAFNGEEPHIRSLKIDLVEQGIEYIDNINHFTYDLEIDNRQRSEWNYLIKRLRDEFLHDFV